jgi:hypothetical protein
MNPPPDQRGPHFSMADGVGCESCHGPAQHWLSVHYLPVWKTLSLQEKIATGFRPTKDLLTRARLCVECHVGSGDRDVNHDLIAAGHPRLNFEYSSYLAIYPRHWDERTDRARHPDHQARTWALGQLVSAQAALDLLAHRAGDESKPWPEFAEYDCFACHKNLSGARSQPRKPQGGRLGGIPWGSWYYPLLEQALPFANGGAEDKVLTRIADVRAEMNRPRPRQAQATALARTAAGQLNFPIERLMLATTLDPAAMRRRLTAVLENGAGGTEGNWDRATQRYLGLAALYHALGDLGPGLCDPTLRNYLERLADQLAFPVGQESPGKNE